MAACESRLVTFMDAQRYNATATQDPRSHDQVSTPQT